MNENDLARRLEEAEKMIAGLQSELRETNKGVVALTAELETKNEQLKDAMMQQVWAVAKLATLGEVAAGVAHELNNPLATLSLKVESLMFGLPDNDPRSAELRIASSEIDRMGKLVAGLLSYGRGKTPEYSTFDMAQEIEKTLILIVYYLQKRKIVVERDYAADLPLIIADRQKLRQVFLNLFTNAADAMPEGGTMTIRLRALGEGGLYERKILFELQDTGTGIATNLLPNVMEPFFTTKPEGKGTGLGLAICRRIIEEHGGSIEIESTQGVGTTVRIVFPLEGMVGHLLEEGS
jgi:signal transduction histidine kinase